MEKIQKEITEESDVGITEYLTKGLLPIKGKIKARYSDFIVNEIDNDGKICYISKTESEKQNKPEAPIPEAKKQENEETKKAAFILKPEFKEKLETVMKNCHDHIDGLIEFFRNISEGILPKDTVHSFICSNMDKTERTSFHKLIKEFYPEFETNTVFLQFF